MLKAFRVVLAVAAVALCLCTLMPLVRTSTWWVRGFDFPRAQIAVLMVLVLAGQAVLGVLAHRNHRKADAEAKRSSIARRAIVPPCS